MALVEFAYFNFQWISSFSSGATAREYVVRSEELVFQFHA